MSLLPARPLRLKRSYAREQLSTSLLIFGLCAALGIGALVYGVMQTKEELAERALWRDGRPTATAMVEGEVKTKNFLLFLPIFHEYRLKVSYRDEAGVERVVKLEATSMLEKADTARDPEVHYDPTNPERVAVNWIAELTWGRWLFTILLFGLAALMPAGGYQFLRVSLRTLRSAKACSTRSDEITVKVLALEKLTSHYGTPLDKWKLTYDLPPSPYRQGGKREVVLDGEPILVKAGEQARAVGLVSRELPGYPTFPLRDLHPYEATSEQRKALELALGSAGARPSV